ncbi:2-hydroxychromene-2-carboxylate isomerase [Azorhizobium oxalatiphilum]|uniref:2-hydroxychromene-2-carboxylate isomerase n=1 Tax=Azorhizobium oxalatiphilum TaxID=980631 RepID=A0A917CFI1_9HYPH|nr:2-hydroxychromene-2-carboxylate isomerase [Azorhizobium oxalatiphilum]GGF87254.1 2-hydroxychromene-2-carboxylate isomerase [Azorhizobium oxalatiphilum]
MSRRIAYFFSVVSPWSFLGHTRFMELAATHGATVDFHPVELGPVFAETGGLPLAKRAPQRQRMRLVELQRWRLKLGLDFHIQPQHWPFDGSQVDRTVLAAIKAGHPVDDLIRRLFSGVWQRQENLADPAVVVDILDELGLPGALLLEQADTEEVRAAYLANRETALAADVFGAPSYVLDGEVFWGQDRLDLLADALASGRPPFSA